MFKMDKYTVVVCAFLILGTSACKSRGTGTTLASDATTEAPQQCSFSLEAGLGAGISKAVLYQAASTCGVIVNQCDQSGYLSYSFYIVYSGQYANATCYYNWLMGLNSQNEMGLVNLSQGNQPATGNASKKPIGNTEVRKSPVSCKVKR